MTPSSLSRHLLACAAVLAGYLQAQELSVELTSPVAGGYSLPHDGPVEVAATASSTAGAITRIDFLARWFVDTNEPPTLIGSATPSGPGPVTGSATWTSPPIGTYDFYAVAYDEAGHSNVSASVTASVEDVARFLWARHGVSTKIANTGTATLRVLQADPRDGSIWLAGVFTGTLTWGGTVLSSADGADVFLIKLDEDGNLQWAQKAGGSAFNETVFALAIDSEGNGVLTCAAGKNPRFGNITVATADSNVLVKYAPNGTVLWAKAYGNCETQYFKALTLEVDGQNRIYVAGYFGGSKPVTIGPHYLSSPTWDFWVGGFDSGGNVRWLWGGGGHGGAPNYAQQFGEHLVISTNRVFVGGYYLHQLTFAGQTHGGDEFNAFVAALDLEGTPLWASVFNDGWHDYAMALWPRDDNTVEFSRSANIDGSMRYFISSLDAAGTVVQTAPWPATPKLSFDRTAGWYSSYTRLGPAPTVFDRLAVAAAGQGAVVGQHDANRVCRTLVPIPGSSSGPNVISVRTRPDGDAIVAGLTYNEAVFSAIHLRVPDNPLNSAYHPFVARLGRQYRVAILEQPAGTTNNAGATVTLRTAARGAEPVHYQWHRGGTPLADATNAVLTLPGAQPADTGEYTVAVWNDFSTATSSVAQVAIRPFGTPVVSVNGVVTYSDEVVAGDLARVVITSQFPSATLFYTLDGSDPTGGELYTAPFDLTQSGTLRVVAFDATFSTQAEAGPLSIRIVPRYPLSVVNRGGGQVTVTPPGGPYLSNTVVQLEATASNGWSFLGWQGDLTGAQTSVPLVMDSPRNVEAVFGTALLTRALGSGSVVPFPDLPLHPARSTVRLSAIPAAGSYFRFWSGAGSGSNSPIDAVVTSTGATYTASFSPLPANTWALTVLIDGDGTVTSVPRANYYAHGTTVALTATPAAGNYFVAWTGAVTSRAPAISLVTDASKLVTATFTNQPLAPFFLVEPAPHTVPSGTPVTFLSEADGIPVPQYQWLRNTVPLPGATQANLTIPDARAAHAGNYQVVASNVAGAITSHVALLTVLNAPPVATLTQPAAGLTLAAPATVNWAATASDTDGTVARVDCLSNGTVAGSDTTAPFGGTLMNLAPGAYTLLAVATDNLGATGTSAPVSLTVTGVPPAITLHPQDLVVLAGADAAFTAAATGTPPLSLQWFREDLEGSDLWSTVAGATGTVCPLPATTPAVAGRYRFVAGNMAGNATSTVARLTVNYALTVSSNGSGHVLPPPAAAGYAPGTVVNLTAIPAANHLLLGWSGDMSGTDNPLPVVMDGHKSVSAAFGPWMRLLTTVADGSGTVLRAPDAPSYTNGVSVLLTAVPDAGNRFVSWSGDATGTVNPVAVLLDADRTVTAAFVTNQPPIVTLVSPAAGAAYTEPATVLLSADALDDAGVTGVEFLAGALSLGTVTAPEAGNPQRFSAAWSNVVAGTYTLTARATDTDGVTSTSAPVSLTVSVPQTAALFRFASATYAAGEADGTVAVAVVNDGTLGGTVNFATVDVTASSAAGGDYLRAQGSLTFTNGETLKTVSITLRDEYLYEADEVFEVHLSNPGGGATLGVPAVTTVTIADDDASAATNSLLAVLFPGSPPATTGRLRVTLLPGGAGGQWRFPWETAWRPGGQTVTNLVADNYPIEFLPLPGYQLLAPTLTAAVGASGLTEVTNEYLVVGSGGEGWLTVGVTPNTLAGTAGWRFLGESTWRPAGATVDPLVEGSHLIEFQPLAGWSTPPAQAVEVVAGQGSVVSGAYLVANSSLGGAQPPAPLPGITYINDALLFSPLLPYAYNGQLRSEAGFGSGFAVREKVVLTAAHLVFNDQTLSYVPQVEWFFQKHAGEFDPPPVAARGWYVLSGYAAARTNDLAGGYAPGQSSPESRQWDVAALYFTQPAARGGYGGYLTSEAEANEWLQSSRLKMLVGYPLDGTASGYGGVVAGRMHATPAINYAFTREAGRVFTTPGFLSFPGNSGGPLYVLHTNNTYHPAAVYLGTLGSASVVRAIDSEVVNLINLAANMGDAGTNFSGGGVTTIIPGPGGGSTLSGYLRIRLGPPAALAAGASWRVQGDPGYATDPAATRPLPVGTNVTVEFKPAPGWTTPASRSVRIVGGQITVIDAAYPPARAATLRLDSPTRLVLSGPPGTSWRLEYRPDWNPESSWTPWLTRQLEDVPATLDLSTLPDHPQLYLRAVLVP